MKDITAPMSRPSPADHGTDGVVELPARNFREGVSGPCIRVQFERMDSRQRRCVCAMISTHDTHQLVCKHARSATTFLCRSYPQVVIECAYVDLVFVKALILFRLRDRGRSATDDGQGLPPFRALKNVHCHPRA